MLNLLLLLEACTPTAESNVLGYYLARRLGTLTMQPETATGTLTGIVTNTTGEAIEGATVVVATRTGTPYAAQTDAQGNYTIQDVPPGQYVPAAVAPGYE